MDRRRGWTGAAISLLVIVNGPVGAVGSEAFVQVTDTGPTLVASDAGVTRPVVRGMRLFGGREGDWIADMATDARGNVYVTGSTRSSDMPTKHASQGDYRGSDAFVAKFDPSGTLLYATFLGGPCGNGGARDDGEAIAVDAAGNAYVAGVAYSHAFPTTPAALKPDVAVNDHGDAFVAKLGPTGALEYSTYLGGSTGLGAIGGNLTGDDGATAIAVDAWGNAYVTGYTDATDFPLAMPVQSEPAGGYDAFLTKIDPTGSRVLFSTYLGGEKDDEGTGVAIGPRGAVVVAGETGSESFPTTPGAFQRAIVDPTADDAFVTVFDGVKNVGGQEFYPEAVDYSTYLGGSGIEDVEDVAVTRDGGVVVAGSTSSNDFPVTAAPLQRRSGAGEDAFVTRFAPEGDRLAFSTYLGGAQDDYAYGLALDPIDDVYVVGLTGSDDFPVRHPTRRFMAGSDDMFAARLSADGRTLRWSTLLGGAGRSRVPLDFAEAVSVGWGGVIVAGHGRTRGSPRGSDALLLTIGARAPDGPPSRAL